MSDSNDPKRNPMSSLLDVWQMPMMLYQDWLKLAMKSLDHSSAPQQPAGHAEDEGQLVVPDAIDDESDRSLFA